MWGRCLVPSTGYKCSLFPILWGYLMDGLWQSASSNDGYMWLLTKCLNPIVFGQEYFCYTSRWQLSLNVFQSLWWEANKSPSGSVFSLKCSVWYFFSIFLILYLKALSLKMIHLQHIRKWNWSDWSYLCRPGTYSWHWQYKSTLLEAYLYSVSYYVSSMED